MKPILGIDYGRARIGLAISDEVGMLAHPLETLKNTGDPVPRIADLITERKIETVVVGMPKTLSGDRGAAAQEVGKFIDKLRSKVPCQIVEWDERLTTAEAQRAVRDVGKTTRQSRAFIDQIAAQIILQGYLDRQQSAVSP